MGGWAADTATQPRLHTQPREASNENMPPLSRKQLLACFIAGVAHAHELKQFVTGDLAGGEQQGTRQQGRWRADARTHRVPEESPERRDGRVPHSECRRATTQSRVMHAFCSTFRLLHTCVGPLPYAIFAHSFVQPTAFCAIFLSLEVLLFKNIVGGMLLLVACSDPLV